MRNEEVRRLACEMKLAGFVEGMCAGMPVETTGRGRTQRWRGYPGRVQWIEGNVFHVSFESVGEQTLEARDIRPRVRRGCPCARCTWEMEHHQ